MPRFSWVIDHFEIVNSSCKATKNNSELNQFNFMSSQIVPSHYMLIYLLSQERNFKR